MVKTIEFSVSRLTDWPAKLTFHHAFLAISMLINFYSEVCFPKVLLLLT